MHDPDAAGAWLLLPVPLLLWAAVRFGPRGLMSGLSLLTVLAIAGIANGQGPSVSGSVVGNVRTLQIFLLGVGVPLFILAVLVREREESEGRYRAVASNYPQGMVLLFGPDTRHLFGDGQGLPELGLSPDSVAGTSLWEAFPAEVAAALAPRYQAALTGEYTSCELVHAGRTYQAQVLPVGPTGAATGMVVMQDVTEQRRAQGLALSEAALRATNEQLEAVSRAKSDFLSVAAHELKTPVTSLRVFATLLIRQLDEGGTIDPERLRRALGMIDQQSDRLSRLISELLDVSRLEAGRLGLSREIHDLMPIVQMTVEAARATTARHSIRVDGPSEMRAYVDSLRLEQVLTNLLDNAVKYSPDGGEVDVTVDAPAPDAVRLVVRDHGIGISTEVRTRIFERFYRGDESGPTSGMGLGLFICRQIVELHGGQIEAEPADGGGTRFVVTLPRNAAGS
jgi:signal transduction histidine kinase